jgi:hypothetical protein
LPAPGRALRRLRLARPLRTSGGRERNNESGDEKVPNHNTDYDVPRTRTVGTGHTGTRHPAPGTRAPYAQYAQYALYAPSFKGPAATV